MNWIVSVAFIHSKVTFCRIIRMQLHTKLESHICDLCLINVNESQNGISSCLDMKMEVNNNAFWMGLTITWDMEYPAREFEISYQGKNESLQLLQPLHVLKNLRDHQGYKKHFRKGHEQSKQMWVLRRTKTTIEQNVLIQHFKLSLKYIEALFGGFLNSQKMREWPRNLQRGNGY